MIFASNYISMARRTRHRAWLRTAVLAGGVLIVVSYFVYQTRDWIRSPQVALVWPPDGATLQSTVVTVEGTVTPGAALTVNGISTYSERNGRFHTELLLPGGLHTIHVTAKNKFGRTSVVERQIVVEETK